jgi:hypothetical protein
MSVLSYYRQRYKRYMFSTLLFGLIFQGCSSGSSLCVLEEEASSEERPPLKKMKLTSNVVVPSNPTGGTDVNVSAQMVQLDKPQAVGYQKEDENTLKVTKREYELLQEDNAVLRSHIEYLEQQNSALRVRVGIDSSPGSSETSGTSGPSMISGTSSASGISGTSEVAVGVNCGRRVAFGRKEWAQFFNCDVGEEPPLPADIDSILNNHCFFWPNKKVKQTHLLVLIPRRVSGRSFTLNELSKLVRCEHLKDVGTKIWHYDTVVKEALGLQSPTHSYWTLITCDALPLDRYKIDADQNVVLSDSLDEAGYMVPDTLEMATAILAHRIRSDEDIYPEASHSYVRCREHVTLNSPAIVGGMSSSGLQIYNFESFITHHPSAYMGVACSRRL